MDNVKGKQRTVDLSCSVKNLFLNGFCLVAVLCKRNNLIKVSLFITGIVY